MVLRTTHSSGQSNESTACSGFPCFRKNVIVTCKIVSFLGSFDNFLSKNVIVCFLRNQISKWLLFWKRAIFELLFTFLVTREKTQKFLQHISHLHTRTFLTLLTFLPSQFCKTYEFIMYGFSLVRLLVLILIRAILEQSINNKMLSKILKLECLLLIFIYTYANFIVICKPWTLNDSRSRLSSIQKTQKRKKIIT